MPESSSDAESAETVEGCRHQPPRRDILQVLPRSRSRSRLPHQSDSRRSSPSPPPGHRHMALASGTTLKPSPIGQCWWLQVLWGSMAHQRLRLPDEPTRPMQVHHFCAGMGTEIAAFKALRQHHDTAWSSCIAYFLTVRDGQVCLGLGHSLFFRSLVRH